MVSIILLAYNQWPVTKACLDSIRENVSIPHEVIVVDNASKDETVEELKKRHDVYGIYNKTNMGFPAGCNIGLAAAKGDVIWFLNNDTIVPKNSLERMVNLLLSDETIGMVGPVTNRISGIQQIPVTYTDNSGIDAFAQENSRKYKNETMRVIRLVGFSLILRKSTLDKLGGFDERMGIGTFEDDDLSLRLVANGYKLLIAKDAFIHHIGNVSFKGAGGYATTDDSNQRIVSTTFEMTVPDETTINESLIERIKSAANILHVECGAGAFGLKMQEEGSKIVGLDSSTRKYNVAREHYNEFYTYKLGEVFQLPINTENFDTVVVEYQFDDKTTLELFDAIAVNIKKGAQVIINIPKLVGKINEIFDTYLDKWDNETGHYAVRGKFDLTFFMKKMEDMGFVATNHEIKDVRRGFFNRNSFTRHRQSWKPQNTDFEFFQELIIECTKK
jgi:O-antigen biosynthesis protein